MANRMALEHSGSTTNQPLDAVAFPFDDAHSITLATELPLAKLDRVPARSRLMVQLLANRGIHGDEAIQAFLQGDWRAADSALPHTDIAIARIHRAIRGGERIVVFGDFDCDGVTSCALLTLALRHMGAHVESYVPRHEDDGRGLNREAVADLAERGANLIITTDCGTANVDEVQLAQSRGVDVIVTDHHPAHGEVAPALAVVNPRLDASVAEPRELAGVGVAFRLAQALLAGAPDPSGHFASTLLDLVAIGTIADVVPLTPENWQLARAGLRRINSEPRPGIRALCAGAHLTPGDIGARDISYAIAPRLNACGRMGKPELAVRLLLAEDPREAHALADQIETLNTERQAVTEELVAAARAQLQPRLEADSSVPVLIASGENWPYGVLGLVAGRLAEEYRRPVFMISRNGEECRGSARGGDGYDLGRLLAGRADLFRRFGGHAQAAGFTIMNGDLDTLLTYIRTHFDEARASEGAEGMSTTRTTPKLVDCRLPLRRLWQDSDVYADLEALEPFGPGFAEPVFLLSRVRVAGCRRSGVNGRTLRLRIVDGPASREVVWSRMGDAAEAIQRTLSTLPPVDIAYALRRFRRSNGGQVEWLVHVVAIVPSR